MGLDDEFNFQVLSASVIEILIDVSLRIDDSGFSFGPDQVRGVCEASQIELFEIH
jgi:hypothetical protein